MTSLILKMSVSLDGYIAPADGSSDWEAAGRSPDGAQWVLDTVANAGAHLVGAATSAHRRSAERLISRARQELARARVAVAVARGLSSPLG